VPVSLAAAVVSTATLLLPLLLPQEVEAKFKELAARKGMGAHIKITHSKSPSEEDGFVSAAGRR
jgi:hypothetical protein